MSKHPLDAPEIRDNLFHVRKTPANTLPNDPQIFDDWIEVDAENGVKLGYRLYLKDTTSPVLLYFHGNGEIASDYEGIAPFYELSGVSLLVVDYRGYGWSTGYPLTSQMLPDTQKVLDKLDSALSKHGVVPGRPLFVKGRSLGSAPAIFLAYANPERFKGLIVESGYAEAPSLFRRLGIPVPEELSDDDTLPLYNVRKMAQVNSPLLVIHGAVDTLIPVINGRELYEASPSPNKELVVISGAGHNNLLIAGTAKYFDAIKRFVEQYR